MSELKVHRFITTDELFPEANAGVLYYEKSEADKVFAEKDAEIERLEILCATYRHDCDNLAISNEQAKRAARTLLKKMNYNKYKRCFAMARLCERKRVDAANYRIPRKTWEFYDKWHKRWLAIAEQFKEAK